MPRKKCYRKDNNTPRKNDTEKITIHHGKMILIPTHYNVYNIIYMYIYTHGKTLPTY